MIHVLKGDFLFEAVGDPFFAGRFTSEVEDVVFVNTLFVEVIILFNISCPCCYVFSGLNIRVDIVEVEE